MKFLDINGVSTLWQKIKTNFIQYIPNGTSKEIPLNESLKFAVESTYQDKAYVEIGGACPFCVYSYNTNSNPDVYNAAFTVGIDETLEGEGATIMLSQCHTTALTPTFSDSYMTPSGFRVANISGYLFNQSGNTINLCQSGADYQIDGVSIIPKAIEDSWLTSNLT